MKRKAFTLVEILIVLVIFWMLSGIMLKTYSTISQVSFRIGQDKELAKESLILSQVLDKIILILHEIFGLEQHFIQLDFVKHQVDYIMKNT